MMTPSQRTASRNASDSFHRLSVDLGCASVLGQACETVSRMCLVDLTEEQARKKFRRDYEFFPEDGPGLGSFERKALLALRRAMMFLIVRFEDGSQSPYEVTYDVIDSLRRHVRHRDW